jgi:copper oxidase (laccase) domain-containing protein
MQREFGTDPADLRIAIGPCIAECCFVVGGEVSEIFRPQFPDRTNLSRIDLAEANRRQLIGCGVRADRIDSAETCTVCSGVEFHSYRRDGERAGRMVAAIGLLA